ncbi:hypothetical protein CEXT_624211 [Caerostris extrusa]|uniref:Uncharacterized protein n=1 Tax=Caerostris extrusa TaxID=172846 RepID=A0AAV4P993_CAEEX|nr:hypothetical protein CEXT_624211 [Caerostris extrusa]
MRNHFYEIYGVFHSVRTVSVICIIVRSSLKLKCSTVSFRRKFKFSAKRDSICGVSKIDNKESCCHVLISKRCISLSNNFETRSESKTPFFNVLFKESEGHSTSYRCHKIFSSFGIQEFGYAADGIRHALNCLR